MKFLIFVYMYNKYMSTKITKIIKQCMRASSHISDEKNVFIGSPRAYTFETYSSFDMTYNCKTSSFDYDTFDSSYRSP